MAKKKWLLINLEELIENVSPDIVDIVWDRIEDIKIFLKTYINLLVSKVKVHVPQKAKYYKDDINGLEFPRLVFSSGIRELWLHIITRSNGDWMGYIFKQLKMLYMEEGMDSYAASKKANDTVHMFFMACDKLSLEWKTPFISYISAYDNKRKKDLQ